jgi:WD40 repeat protein
MRMNWASVPPESGDHEYAPERTIAVRQHIKFLCVLGHFVLLSPYVMAQQPAADTGVLDVTLPAGAEVTVNGTSYGAERHFEMKPLQSDRLYPYDVVARFRGGATMERRVLIKGGWSVRLTPPPSASGREVVLQTGHNTVGGSVNVVTFSPNGRYVLTHAWSGPLILWDARSGQQLRSFDVPTVSVYRNGLGDVKSIAFSPDGQSFIMGSQTNRAILYDLASGKQLRVFEGHTEVVTSVAFSPDGRHALTGSLDKTAMMWDVATGQQIRAFQGHTDGVTTVAFSPDGRHALTGASDKTAIMWDASTGQQMRTLQGHSASVCSSSFSADGRHLVTASNDDSITLWDVASGQQIRSLALEKTYTLFLPALSPDGRHALTYSSKERAAILWNVASGNRIRTFQWPAGPASTTLNGPQRLPAASAAFSPDGSQVIIGYEGSAAIVWDVASGRQVCALQGHIDPVNSVAFSPDGHQILAGSRDRTATLWDAVSGERLRVLEGHGLAVSSVAFSPDGHQVTTGSWDHSAIIWDAQTGQKLQTLLGPRWLVSSVAFSPDGRQVLTGSWSNTAILWDAATGQQIRSFQGHASFVTSVAFSPDGRGVLTGSADKSAIIWDTETGQTVHHLQGHTGWVGSVAFSPDGRRALTGSVEAILWDAVTGAQLRALPNAGGSVAFSPDGRHALTGSSDDGAILWDSVTAKKLRTFPSAGGPYAFKPDGRQILTGSGAGTTGVWDIATGDELARLINLDAGRDWLVMTPDGLFDGSAGGREKVMYRVGGGLNVVPVDRFFQDFYRPGLLSEVSRGTKPLPEVRLSHGLPPRLKVVTPQSGNVETAEATLEVDAADQGGGIAKLAIYQNGARVLAPGQSRADGKTVHRSFKVGLVEGQNRLRITASTTDGSWESEPAEIVLTYERPLARSRLYFVAVGVNRYADANLNLKFAARDAESFAELFRRRGAGLYEQVNVTTLLDDQATRAGIHNTLKKVAAETRPQDTLVLFLAGHGTMVGQRYYFVPHELRRKAELLEDDIRHQAIPADELSDDLGSSKALKRMLILDTCASGGALAVAMKGRSGFALRGAIERLSRTQGIFTIAASSASEEAQEAKQLGHGVLSYALLAGLKAVDGGPLDGQFVRPSNPEGVVDVLEWFSFAAGQVPRLTEKLYGASQDVQTSAQGASFPVLPLEVR